MRERTCVSSLTCRKDESEPISACEDTAHVYGLAFGNHMPARVRYQSRARSKERDGRRTLAAVPVAGTRDRPDGISPTANPTGLRPRACQNGTLDE